MIKIKRVHIAQNRSTRRSFAVGRPLMERQRPIQNSNEEFNMNHESLKRNGYMIRLYGGKHIVLSQLPYRQSVQFRRLEL
jgi:hypothetical protein